MLRAVVFSSDSIRNRQALFNVLKTSEFEIFDGKDDAEVIRLVDDLLPNCVVIPVIEERVEQCLRLADTVRVNHRCCSVLLMCSKISTELAMRALRIGASDVLEIDAPREIIASAVKGILSRVWQPLQPMDTRCDGGEKLIGRSAAIQNIRQQIASVASTSANVLITGESGTGKELAAELIHRNSKQRSKPFVSVNCAAIPDALLEAELFGHERGAFTGANASRQGKFQYASGGSLFLDEVGDLSLPSQAKILRAVESRVIQRLGSNVDVPIQVRLISATNRNLEQLADENNFRRDLYFRLNVIPIHLLPLRERKEDIPELVEHMMQQLSSDIASPVRYIEHDVIHRLEMHTWPGNVRELRNVIESILVFARCRSVRLADVPPHILMRLRASEPDCESERSRIIDALSTANWNRAKAANILHCSRMTLYRKMTKLCITEFALARRS